MVYPAVRGYRCIFFSSDPIHRCLVEKRGWQFRHVESLPPLTDYQQCSIQAKYIKFLQFFDGFRDLSAYEHIIYFDHTIFFRRREIAWLRATHDPGYPVFLLRHVAKDRTLLGEVEAASSQPRYALTMPETVGWLKDLESHSGIRLDSRVDATTIISYRHPERVRPLLDRVYSQTLLLSQPECQIIWSALAQEFPSAVQRVEWNSLDPLWRVPYQSHREWFVRLGRRVLHRLRRSTSD